MKIQGGSKTGGVNKAKKAESKGDAGLGDGGFDALIASHGAAETSSAAATGASQSIAQVDALLAVQEVEDPTQGAAKKRMRKRSTKILDMLDGLRDQMLGGGLTLGHMIDIADVVASHREQITDPTLTGIMDEIDLRAQVELAKMRVALEARG
ncbi:MAG: flagellar assembly protein FliX [Alphaproteobacteria bacterium]